MERRAEPYEASDDNFDKVGLCHLIRLVGMKSSVSDRTKQHLIEAVVKGPIDMISAVKDVQR
jgi:hypothetical protein